MASWTRPVAALGLCLALALGVGGCGEGGGDRHASVTTSGTTSPPAPHRAHTFVTTPANALVAMRRLSPKSLMWQTVFVRRDGSGVLTSLIGEISGAPQKRFHLSAPQLTRLHRLVAVATPVHASSRGLGDYVYTLTISGSPASNLGGRMPPQLSALVGFLGALMTRYCC